MAITHRDDEGTVGNLMGGPRYGVSPEDFIEAWQSSSTCAEVTAKTGLNAAAARSRAYFYRQRGLPLKLMRTGREALDIVNLKKQMEKKNCK
jgi:hypothetical protein